MTAHLPECSVRTYTTDDGMVYEVAGDLCICPALRACEQRVRESMRAYLLADDENVYAHGYRDALSAARDAVESHFHAGCDSCDAAFIFGMHALAALDALREHA